MKPTQSSVATGVHGVAPTGRACSEQQPDAAQTEPWSPAGCNKALTRSNSQHLGTGVAAPIGKDEAAPSGSAPC
jgi:hypothetical protein